MYGKNEICSRVATETQSEKMKIKSAQLFFAWFGFFFENEEGKEENP